MKHLHNLIDFQHAFEIRVHCPICKKEMPHRYRRLAKISEIRGVGGDKLIGNISKSNIYDGHCLSCEKTSIHLIVSETEDNSVETILIYPPQEDSDVPECCEEAPEELKDLYTQAAKVFQYSPKASAALLRLCVQEILKAKGAKETNLNKAINNFCKQPHISTSLQKSLECCRLVGNHAVHPGLINIDENIGDVMDLFDHVNDIFDELYAKPIRKERTIRKFTKKNINPFCS